MKVTVKLPPAPKDPIAFRDALGKGIDPRSLPHHPELKLTLDSPLLDGCDKQMLEALGLKLLMDCRDSGHGVPKDIRYYDSWNHEKGAVVRATVGGKDWALMVRYKAKA
jgi:hypothetical protein